MKIALLGCTGSIGRTILKIVEKHPEEYEIVLLANGSDTDRLCKTAMRLHVSTYYCATGMLIAEGKERPFDPSFLNRPETYRDADVVINAISGTNGVLPSFAALQAGKVLALANKESVVCAGNLLTELAKETGEIRPIDSEHSTVWQCIGDAENVKRILLTCSGGAFRDVPKDRLPFVTAQEALRHPNWSMGAKITVDCATLVNKGLEIIEAKRLFGIDDVCAVLHRESIVHALVEMRDGALIAGLSNPDMEIPVQYALSYPKRIPTTVGRLDIASVRSLSFSEIDRDRFPCFALCEKASDYGDYAGSVLAAADDVAAEAFLRGKIGFYGVYDVLAAALEFFGKTGTVSTVEDVVRIEKSVKEYTYQYIEELPC